MDSHHSLTHSLTHSHYLHRTVNDIYYNIIMTINNNDTGQVNSLLIKMQTTGTIDFKKKLYHCT